MALRCFNKESERVFVLKLEGTLSLALLFQIH